jgi:hypothetical protein
LKVTNIFVFLGRERAIKKMPDNLIRKCPEFKENFRIQVSGVGPKPAPAFDSKQTKAYLSQIIKMRVNPIYVP